MAAADTVKIIVKVDSKKARINLKKTGKVGSDAAKKIEVSFKSTTSALKVMQGVVGAQALLGGFQRLANAASAAFTAVISDASDAQESLSKFGIVFKDVEDEAEKVADDLAKDFGLATAAAKTLLGNTGDLLTGFKFTQKASLELSKQVQELAVDLASFTNFAGGAEGASNALTKALLGERDSVKALGIAILEEDVKKQVAIDTANGLTFATKRQAKAIATMTLIVRQSKNAIGDYARTSGEYANQQRLLEAVTKNLSVAIGIELIPMMTELTKVAVNLIRENKDLLSSFAKIAAIEIKEIIRQTKTEYDFLTDSTGKLMTASERAALGVLNMTAVLGGAVSVSKLLSPVIAKTGISLSGLGSIFSATALKTKSFWLGLLAVASSVVGVNYVIDKATKRIREHRDSIEGLQTPLKEYTLNQKNANQALWEQLGLLQLMEGKKIQIIPFAPGPFVEPEPEAPAVKKELSEAQKLHNAEMALLREEDRISNEEYLLRREETEGYFNERLFVADFLLQVRRLDAQFTFERAKLDLIKNSSERERAIESLAAKKKLARTKLYNKQEMDFTKKAAQHELQTQQVLLTAKANFATAGARIAKEGTAANKILMMASAGIAAYTAANLALAQPPGPPTTLPLSYSVLALGLTNVVAAGGYKFAKGGIVGGNSFTGDNIQARLNSGEMVLNKQQQAQLFKQANGGEGNSEMISAINNLASRPVLLIADDQAIARSVSRGVDEGIIIGGGQ